MRFVCKALRRDVIEQTAGGRVLGSHSLSGEIYDPESGERAALPTVPLPVLEAIYATVTGAKESIEVHRRKAKKIQVEDIRQLEYLVFQWVSPYSPISNKSQIIVTNTSKDELRGKTRTVYESYESFVKHEVGKTDPTSSISFYFSFITKNSDTEKLETIEVIVDMPGATYQYPYAMSSKDPLGYRERLRQDPEDLTLRVSVKYTNYIMAKGVIGVIDDWYDNVDDIEIWVAPKMARAIPIDSLYNPFGAALIFLRSFPIFLAVLMVRGISSWGEASFLGVSDGLINYLLIGIIVFAVVDSAFRFIIGRIEGLVGRIALPLVMVNGGDERRAARYQSVKRSRTSSYQFVFRSLIAAFIVSLAAGIVTNLLPF